MKKYIKFLKIAFPIVALIALLCFAYSLTVKPSIELVGEEKIILEYGEEFNDPGATGQYSSLFTKNKALKINKSGNFDEDKVGSYTITYTASKMGKSKKVKRIVEIIDTIAPEIKLNISGDSWCIKGEDYKEEGFVATDNYDGDITDQVVTSIEEDIVTYTVKDSSGNEATETRKIRYDLPPVITLSNGETINFTIGNTFKDPGYSANDERDGDLTSKVIVEGNVDTSKEGSYTLTYSVTDQSNQKTTVTRTVNIVKQPVQTDNPPTGHKVVYLTFDDGPGPYTQRLLDICAKYNVKVTFFVTNQFPAYQGMIAKEAAAGHAVAIHTYSHDYSIYQNSTTFYNDLYAMQNLIQQQTGIKTNLMRFPGGGSNMISKNYCPGIMTTLTQSVQQNGFVYFDWNVSSGDAGGTTTAAGVAQNVINGLKTHDVSVVLQHDIKQYSVEATDQIISWGLQNGYTFLPLTSSSFTAHHKVNN